MPSTVNVGKSRVQVRVADAGFAAYINGSDFSFQVDAYAEVAHGVAVTDWPLCRIASYRKCYGIDPEEFSSYRNAPDSEVFMAYLDGQAVGHVVVSTNWNGYGHIDELAVHAPARGHGVARTLLEVAQFWSRRKGLPGVMLETQNNNLGACRLYERCGYVVGGVDRLRYRGIDPQTREVAIFWYLLFAEDPAGNAS
ncbi:GNAT family N-acetyltransferase [Pseudomonas sessilinigenes]|uniref:GNAT family N-acetyltransferase n=1 Tax=Pseudomonas sessilinigenes TaxID=658629 RepID=A0ABX8MWI4_9PSED|nr:GNAT family N-acetyltransferase [Pseudomonas sessilinigenes]AZC24476.1 Streptothricin acetyltransferase [Pseudomonas sessilinigenes]QXH43412.1 GNAT family N-acetyltransferase [Pseudomonas sessilinigenes]